MAPQMWHAVINRADWCPVCKANGPRVMQEVMLACKDMKVKFVMNDLTDKKTIAQSKATLQKEDVYKAVEGQPPRGSSSWSTTKQKRRYKRSAWQSLPTR